MNRIVPPEINQPRKGAPLIVGRDPGTTETQQGRPFVGQSGVLLFGGVDPMTGTDVSGALRQMGLQRKDVNITNRVLRQPPGNEFKAHRSEDVVQGRTELLALIRELEPSIIITCGNEAAYDLVPNWATLTDKYPGEYSGGHSVWEAGEIIDRRGFFFYNHDLCDAPILPTLHPASTMYKPMPGRLMLDIDFMRAGAWLRGELPRREWPKYHRIFTRRDMEAIWDSELVAFDIETTWGGDKLLCIGFYTREGQGFLAYDDAFYACEEWLLSDRPKLAHNGQFDRYYCDAKLNVPVGGRHEDTIVGHWSCYPELAGKEDTGREDQKKKTSHTLTRKGLNFLASFHLNVEWWKTYGSDRNKMGQLCVNDVAATMWCWEIIEPEIDAMGVRAQYERQMAKIPALIQIQKRGFLIDESLRNERIEALTERSSVLEDKARKVAEAFIIEQGLRHQPNGKEYWWYHAARCGCCGGGKKRALHCNRCLSLDDKLSKKDLADWAWRFTKGRVTPAEAKQMKKGELEALMPACQGCKGKGKIDTWDVNIMSSTQMTALMYDILAVPKHTAPGGKPAADDETLSNILMWAKGEQE